MTCHAYLTSHAVTLDLTSGKYYPYTKEGNITWFIPPYSRNVETNVGKCFLSLIDKHFPKSNPLHKIFNRNTLKLSYSCMGNIKIIITNHNKAVISKPTRTNNLTKKSCNCRKPNECPMDGNCNVESVIYQAEVTTETTKETYIGLCDTAFKLRYRNHSETSVTNMLPNLVNTYGVLETRTLSITSNGAR